MKSQTWSVAHTLQVSPIFLAIHFLGLPALTAQGIHLPPFTLPHRQRDSITSWERSRVPDLWVTWWNLNLRAVLQQFFFPSFGNVAGNLLGGSMGTEVFFSPMAERKGLWWGPNQFKRGNQSLGNIVTRVEVSRTPGPRSPTQTCMTYRLGSSNLAHPARAL